MGIRVDQNKVEKLSVELKSWAVDVEHNARNSDQSLHDSLVDLLEQSNEPLSHVQCVQLMEAMGEYWD
jgi:hypothetical protein